MQSLRLVCRMLGSQQPMLFHHRKPICNHQLITNQKCFISNHEKKSSAYAFMVVMKTIPSGPITAIRNLLTVLYVKHILGQQFQLAEFLEACPHAVQTVAQILPEAEDDKSKKENLKGLMSDECMEYMLANWDDLETRQQADVAQMDPRLCLFYHPQLFVVRKGSDSRCLLRARMTMVQFMDTQLWGEYLNEEYKNFLMTGDDQRTKMVKAIMESLSGNTVELERDVTKGTTDSSWTIINMGDWPKPFPFLKK